MHMVVLPQPAALEPTAQDAIAHIVAAEGDLDLAAERLFGPPPLRSSPNAPVPAKARLIALIADDPSSQEDLQKQLRTLTLLQTFQTTRLVAVTVEGTLDRVPAADRAKLYTSLLTILTSLTDPHSTSFSANINSSSSSTSLNLTEMVLRQLPPEVRDAIKVLATPDTGLNLNTGADTGSSITTLDGEWSGGSPPPNAANGTSQQ